MPEATLAPAPIPKRTGAQLLVRATKRGFYPAAPGRHTGMMHQKGVMRGWSVHQHVREAGDVFPIAHEGHFSREIDEPGQQFVHGWMVWADEPVADAQEAPASTAAYGIQDPLSIEGAPHMVPVEGQVQWPGAGQPEKPSMAERAALSAFRPEGSQVAQAPVPHMPERKSNPRKDI